MIILQGKSWIRLRLSLCRRDRRPREEALWNRSQRNCQLHRFVLSWRSRKNQPIFPSFSYSFFMLETALKNVLCWFEEIWFFLNRIQKNCAQKYSYNPLRETKLLFFSCNQLKTNQAKKHRRTRISKTWREKIINCIFNIWKHTVE